MACLAWQLNMGFAASPKGETLLGAGTLLLLGVGRAIWWLLPYAGALTALLGS